MKRGSGKRPKRSTHTAFPVIEKVEEARGALRRCLQLEHSLASQQKDKFKCTKISFEEGKKTCHNFHWLQLLPHRTLMTLNVTN